MTEHNTNYDRIQMKEMLGERPGFTLQTTMPFSSVATQAKVDKLKAIYVNEDLDYLVQHPEVGYIIELLTIELLKHRPSSATEFASDLFNRSDIRELISQRSKKNMEEKFPTENWNLKPYTTTDWKNAPQMELGVSSDSDDGDDDDDDDDDGDDDDDDDDNDDMEDNDENELEEITLKSLSITSEKSDHYKDVEGIILKNILGEVERRVSLNEEIKEMNELKLEEFENFIDADRDSDI